MEEALSDVCFQKISEASPFDLKSDSAVLYFGGLGQMDELLCQFPLPYTKKRRCFLHCWIVVSYKIPPGANLDTW